MVRGLSAGYVLSIAWWQPVGWCAAGQHRVTELRYPDGGYEGICPDCGGERK